MEIKYGGKLKSGDFIAVSRSNYVELGWYTINEKGKSVFYYSFLNIKNLLRRPNCELKDFYRSFATDPQSRTILISNPLQILEPEDQEVFLKGTELLKKFKFIK